MSVLFNSCIGPPTATCGKSPVTRVIGGVDAQPGNWPWQVRNTCFCSEGPEVVILLKDSDKSSHARDKFI